MGGISQQQFNDFQIYNCSTIQKLRSSKYFYEKLVKFMSTPNKYDQSGLDELLCYLNLYLDGFLYNYKSAADVFAHELNLLYDIMDPDVNIYMNPNFIKKFKEKKPSASIITHLDYFDTENNLFKVANKYRNYTTHRCIPLSSIELTQDLNMITIRSGKITYSKCRVTLPDDPFAINPTYNNNYDILYFCKEVFCELLEAMDKIYELIGTEIDTQKSIPL